MALAASHPNIELKVYSEVKNIRRNGDGTFKATIVRKPTFVDFAKCTGCQDCEKVCSVTVPDNFNFDLVSRRAAYIAFPQAVPKKAVIEREGTSPCTYACPAGIKANGYISLARRGDFEKAFNLIMEDAPLVGSLGRACYAPCQPECTREKIGDAPEIKLLKRFIADWYYERHPEPEYGPPAEKTGKSVAIVGSGPSGLTAAYFLAKKGHRGRDLRGGRRGRRDAPVGAPAVPPAEGRRRPRRQERDGARRRDPDRREGRIALEAPRRTDSTRCSCRSALRFPRSSAWRGRIIPAS